jgi:hypothetical protein
MTMNGTLLGEVARIWRLAIDYVNDRQRSRQAAREFARLDPDEAIRILSDAGLTRREFDKAMLLPFASEDLLSRAMESAGIDVAAFRARDPEWFRDLRRTCMTCGVRGRCRRVIERGEFAARCADFCVNSWEFVLVAETGSEAEGREFRRARYRGFLRA